jgi:hypothetical protein
MDEWCFSLPSTSGGLIGQGNHLTCVWFPQAGEPEIFKCMLMIGSRHIPVWNLERFPPMAEEARN